MKFKKKIPIEIVEGGVGNRTRIRPPSVLMDMYFKQTKKGPVASTKRKTSRKKRSRRQNRQQLRFRYCDCLWRVLFKIWEILEEWVASLNVEAYKKRKIRSVFMSKCLKADLYTLLHDFLGLDIEPISIEETDKGIIIKTRVYSYIFEEPREDTYLPNPYRYARG